MKLKNNKFKAILFFGPPGSGKSTQAKLLSKKRFFYISTGEILRKLEQNVNFIKSNLEKSIAKIMALGNLIPDNTMFELLQWILAADIKKKIFNPQRQILILDGTPRDISQVKKINSLFHIIKIIDLYAPDDSILIKRIAGRAKRDSRPDDKNIETIRKRLAVYKKETAAVLSRYPKKIIIKINGLGAIKKIHRQINAELKNIT
jgi:adenylate kinase